MPLVVFNLHSRFAQCLQNRNLRDLPFGCCSYTNNL